MAKTEGMPATNDTLLALIASLQSLTLALHANMAGTAAQQATPPPTAMPASSNDGVPASVVAVTSPAPATTAPAVLPAAGNVTPAAPAVLPAAGNATTAAPAVLPAAGNATTAAPAVLPAAGPRLIPPPAASVSLAAVYLTPQALSSRGVHPTILEILPHIVDAPESGTWFAVTVGKYTSVYQEWPQVHPLVSRWSGACYTKYSMKSSALAAYDNAFIQGLVQGGVHPDHRL